MIDVHFWPTPNGFKVTIMLEEIGHDYRIVPVDIGVGDQFTPDFLRIAPNNRMPAIVDHAPADGGEPIGIFESGAILEYLADKSGQLLPTQPRERAAVLQWVHWQMANLGPMMGNANHFRNYGKTLTDDPGQLEYGTRRFVREVDRLAGVMDAQLSVHEYLAGAEYSIADIITWPWARFVNRLSDDEDWSGFGNVKRWVEQVGERAAVQRGKAVGRELGQRQRSAEEEKRRQELLFNQDSAKVRAAREAAARKTADG